MRCVEALDRVWGACGEFITKNVVAHDRFHRFGKLPDIVRLDQQSEFSATKYLGACTR